MRPRSALFPHQEDMAAQIGRRRELAVLVELGYGKTAGTLTGLVDAGALPALVVAPAYVADTVWAAEAAQWEHLAKLRVATLTGDAEQRHRGLCSNFDVATISYESLMWLTDNCDVDAMFKAIVFDELSKMKTPGTKRFRRMRARGVSIPTRVGLTGSPVPNHLLDLWGEMFMVAGEKPLGPRYTDYKSRYFEANDFYHRVWKLKGLDEDGNHTIVSRHLEKEIHTRISPWCYVVPPGQVVIPPVHVDEVSVTMPKSVERQQRQLVEELFTILQSGVEIEALQKSALSAKLRQFASGAVYIDPEGAWEEVHDAKISVLDDKLDELQGEPVLIFYWFKHEAERIRRMLTRTGRTFAEVGEHGALDQWNARRLEVLLAHPQSAGHGLNLQHGGHHLIWFALPWAHELWKQGNGRLARTGQSALSVIAHCLLCGAADHAILARLRQKGSVEDALIDSLLIRDLL